jgi:BMFP domain-containing protein YqiC
MVTIMEAVNKNVEPDIVGRVMALEQRTRGLNGRVSALEMRFSQGAGEASADFTEFVPGEAPRERRGASLDERVRALEASLSKKPPTAQKMSMLDVTGIVVGLSMLAVGMLLATDSIDLLRNPLLAFAGGFIILACATWRLLQK